MNFKQGEEVKIELSIVESPAIDFNNATAIRVLFLQGTNVIQRYAVSTIAGYGIVEVDDVDANKLNIFVTRDQSVNFPAGNVKATILADFPNAEFPDGTQVRCWDNLNVGNVRVGTGLDENI